jgi:subtilisin family serine protease
MDAVFDAQFRIMKDDFARRGIRIETAYKPNGDVDYVYQAGQLLTVHTAARSLARLPELMPDSMRGIRPVDGVFDRAEGELVALTSDHLDSGAISVPQALELMDGGDGRLQYSPDHVVHISRICPAVEPEVPSGYPTEPWPPARPSTRSAPSSSGDFDVLLGVSDTGLLADLDPKQYHWLANVTGAVDPLGPPTAGGLPQIPAFAGHGTFVAGVATCLAPDATVIVNDHFSTSGGELESVIVQKLEELVRQNVDIINLSAGTYTRNNWSSLGFDSFHRRHPTVTLVAAAGNDSTDRPFFPAAYDWVISVGALGVDEKHRAWFSNYGDWVDVYAIGEGLVNAYATGEYSYQEPPKLPAVATFEGMARWDGTSFSAPLVAGLIAARMARTGESSGQAAAGVITAAQGQVVPGIGPVLYFGDQP